MAHSPNKRRRIAASFLAAMIMLQGGTPALGVDNGFGEGSFDFVVSTSGDTLYAEGVYSIVKPAPAPPSPVSDPEPGVPSVVVGAGRGVEVDVGSADEWNQALKECLAHAADGPILIPRCRVILGLDTPNADEPDGGDGEDSAPVSVEDLSPGQVVDYARTQETITGAGLGWQPRDNALVGLPMLVHASTPTQTLALSVLGQQVVVEVEAAGFSYDFGDNTAPLKTTDPSAPYPVTTLNHVYTQTSPATVITLTTTWNARITYPSGRTAYLANALTTTETSTPITIREATITLTTLNDH